MGNFLKNLQRDLKKGNVKWKQILKKGSLTQKTKNRKFNKLRKKEFEKFGETRKCKIQDETDTDDKKQSRSCSSKWLVFFEKT